MKPSTEQLRAAAKFRVDRALQLIEQAQGDLNSACADLSTLVGGVPVWKATSTMADKVKALWYRVHNFRMGGRYSLDDMHVQALAKSLEEQATARALLQGDDAAQLAAARRVVEHVMGPGLDWPK